MSVRKLCGIAALSVLCSAADVSHTSAQTPSGIEGVITVGPIHGGPARDGIPHTRPLANAAFLINNRDGVVVARFVTDGEGRFRVSLPPDHYIVTKERHDEPGQYGPFDVDVTKDKVTQVLWNCDDGRM